MILAEVAANVAANAANVAAQVPGPVGNIHIGLASAGAAIGIGIAAAGAEVAIGRNPGTFGKVFTTMLIGMALAEGLAILAYFLIPHSGL